MKLTDEQIEAIFDIIDWIQDENGATRREALEEVSGFLECGLEEEDRRDFLGEELAGAPTADA